MVLTIDQPKDVIIKGVKLSLRCEKCGHEWGVSLDELGRIPYHGDRCVVCWKQRTNSVMNIFHGENHA